MHFAAKIKSLVTAHPYLMFGVAAILGGSALYANSLKNDDAAETISVRHGAVTQTVSVTGKVVPGSEVDLSFDRTGRIAIVYRAVGDRVLAGALLVALESGELSAQIEQARASVRAKEAKLAELERGTRPEDIAVSEAELTNAKEGAMNDIRSALIKSDDAIRNKVDQLFTNPRGNAPQLKITVNDTQLEIDIESGRVATEQLLTSWSSSVANMSIEANLMLFIGEAKTNMRALSALLDKLALAVNVLTPTSALSQSSIDTYKADVFAARTNINTELSSIITAEEDLRNAQSKLALKRAGTLQEVLDAQNAEIDAARANVSNLESQIGKMLIRAPLRGVVTKMEAKRGEIAVSGNIIVSVISDAKYEVEAFVPEADIAKIKLGSNASITLDAYGSDDVFEAAVVRIDPAETVIDGVATYKTTLQFAKYDLRVKPGMTANTDIEGARKENVLIIPGRAISQKGSQRFVHLLEGESVREVEIKAGLRGSNGDIEIISGLDEGDRVIID